jgi:hypothetical protein
MPLLGRLLGFFAASAALPFIIWAGRNSPLSETAYREAAAEAVREALAERRRIAAQEQLQEAKKPKPRPVVSGPPAIATKPPYPKLEIDEQVFEFGTLHVGERKSHVFLLKNVGEASLELVSPPTCGHAPPPDGMCGGWRKSLRTGETYGYEMKWSSRSAIGCFELRTALFTNDPRQPRIELTAHGKVVGPLPRVAIDERVFDFGTGRVGQPMRHVFHFKNIGEAPLEIYPAPVCGHAIPPNGTGWRKLIQPGSTFDLEMKWTAHEAPPNFAIHAAFITNDPEQPEIAVKILGKIIDAH